MRAIDDRSFDVSLVIPCYNEQEAVAFTIQKLLAAFRGACYNLEVVAVDNGSQDETGRIIAELAAADDSIIPHRVAVNEGYGNGILCGIPLCTAPWIGMIPADGQVDAEDVVRLYEAALSSGGPSLLKVRRRFRMDGLARKVVSIAYNLYFRLLWPRIASLDINGSPKLLPREVLLHIQPTSKNWLLDPEIMTKAHAAGVPVIEMNVFARMRSSGVSHVRPGACWEFLYGLLRFRLREYRRWKRQLQRPPIAGSPPVPAGGSRPVNVRNSRETATAHSS
jgi:glycosyltransferase involved in cell wall biosynthesis